MSCIQIDTKIGFIFNNPLKNSIQFRAEVSFGRMGRIKAGLSEKSKSKEGYLKHNGWRMWREI